MDKGRECPLCLEQLEMDDVNFFPCKCGYQICRFCWHRIRTNDNGLCPHCRRHYPENPANFKPLTPEELQQLKHKKKQKDLKKKQKISECRKQLANIRVVQKNLVFVVGLPQRLVDVSESEKISYFKQFGKIQKLIINTNTTYAGSQGPSSCAYVTYNKPQEAYGAVQALNNTKIEGRNIKASLGTTKYCSNFLKKLHCPKQDCMYLHEIAESAASFTKEQIQLGKHLEYEQKLYEQISTNNQNHHRKESTCSELTDSDESLNKDKVVSSTKEQSRESFQSCSNGKESSVNLAESNQIIQSQDHAKHTTNQVSDQNLTSLFLHCESPSSQAAVSHPKLDQKTTLTTSRILPCDNSNSNSFFSTTMPIRANFSSPIKNEESSSQEHFPTIGSNDSHVLEFQSRNSQVIEAKQPTPLPESNSIQLNSMHSNMRWMNAQIPEKKSLLTLFNNTEEQSFDRPVSPVNGDFMGFVPPTSNSSLFFNSFSSSSQNNSECFNHVHNSTLPFPAFVANGDVYRENTFRENHDNDLDFDPCQESLKGLKDLMNKEEEEAARIIYSSNITYARSSVIPKAFADHSSELADTRNSFHSQLRFTNPPPGFQQGGLAPSVPSLPSFLNANLPSSRVSQISNLQSQFQPQSVRSQFSFNRLPLQNGLHSSLSSENRSSMFHEAYELPSRKSLNILPQSTGSAFTQPPFSNVGQSSPSSWNGVGQVNSSIKPLENSFYNQSFSERSASPLHMRALQHSFNELSMKQLQQNGVRHDSTTQYTDQFYSTLLRNLQQGYSNGS